MNLLTISLKISTLLAITLFSFSITPVFSQNEIFKNDDSVQTASQNEVGFQAGIALELGLPHKEFHKNITNPGYGIGLHFAVAPHAAPIMYGVEANYMMYGYENQSIPFNGSSAGRVNVDLQTTNGIFSGHFFTRLQPKSGIFRPYVDALVGFNYFNTQSSIQNEITNEDIVSSINFDDAAFSYGGGLGVMFEISRGELFKSEKKAGQFGSTLLDFRVRYMRGEEADYLRKGSIQEDPTDASKVTYDVFKSRTDMLTFHVGVAVSL